MKTRLALGFVLSPFLMAACAENGGDAGEETPAAVEVQSGPADHSVCSDE